MAVVNQINLPFNGVKFLRQIMKKVVNMYISRYHIVPTKSKFQKMKYKVFPSQELTVINQSLSQRNILQ
jgi:hypothetical protein